MAPVVFKTTARRIASWVGSIPMHSRQHIHRRPHPGAVTRRSPAVAAFGVALLVLAPALALGQRADSARVAARPPAVDTAVRRVPAPPLSPRRAFLYSLVLPGYAQSILGRSTAGAIFVLSESIALAMLRESRADLTEARNLRRDSVVVIGFDPATGAEITATPPYDDGLVNLRKGHVEDWVAFIIANHLFAAADAYVGAHLWDLPSQISVRSMRGGTVLAARVAW